MKSPAAAFIADDLEILRPLLRSRPNTSGEIMIPGLDAVCLDCGARDDQVMIRKHRKNCPHTAYFKALTALAAILGPEKKRRNKRG